VSPVAQSSFSGHSQWPEVAMRVVAWFIAFCCLASPATGQKNGFQEPCSSHIQSTWTDELRRAAQADCRFFEEAQKSAAAWANFAEEDAVMSGLNGREEIRARFEKVYAKPGFRLLWFPTGGEAYGHFVITTGTYERHALDEKGKETVTNGRYVTVWHKQPDGSYLYVWDGGE
jgi:ketosteroid isomerase-like protein